MKPGFGGWILIILLVCTAIAYWYVALALAVATFLVGSVVWALREQQRTVEPPLYVSDVVDPPCPSCGRPRSSSA